MDPMSLGRCIRRRCSGPGIAAAGLLLGLLSPIPPALAQPFPELELEVVTTGLPRPTAIVHAGDARLFVVLQSGEVRIVRGGVVEPEPFLDIRARVSSTGERGLLSIVFHPDYSSNGWFFANYTDVRGNTVVSRFDVGADPDRGDPDSEVVLLRIEQLFPNHNGGQLAFGPDGMLYIATGDGGSAFDPYCSAQDRSTLLGKLLRLDVGANPTTPPYHGVPPDNPFVGNRNLRDEIWAYGLRNPWRFSFDRATGDLYVADVGQSRVEEVNFLASDSTGGANFGWKVMEGDACTENRGGCTGIVPACGSSAFVAPILTYPTGSDCAITGGFVYRGRAIPGLVGHYVFGDFCSGRLWAARRNASGEWVRRVLPPAAPSLQTFGEDVLGEIYLGAGDRVLKLVEAAAEPEPEPCVEDDHTLCLGSDGRFAVEASFRVGGAPAQPAGNRPITSDTGGLWFFDEDNLELIVKVLDACPVSGHHWVFAAGLTDVETELVVTDTKTGTERRYVNPAGTAFRPVQDTGAFAGCP